MQPERASTGIAGLDAAIDGLRIGDNVVWRVDDLADFRGVLDPFLARCRTDRRQLVYLRFGTHAPLLDAVDGVDVHELDPREGFEAFAVAVHELIAAHGRRAFYVFDCLTELLDAWHSDLMVANFFRVTCPWLFELDTIAWFALLREEHTAATVAAIRATTQVLLDLRVSGGATYVHPLKVDGRSSPTMFFPHRLDGDTAHPVTSSDASARLVSPFGRLTTRPDRWQRDVDAAFAALDADAAAQASAAELLRTILVGRSGRIVDLARTHLHLPDLLVAASRLVGTGRIGGKAVGMLLARAILAHDPADRFSDHVEPHDSFHIGADVFYTFLVTNGWWDRRLAQRSAAGFLSAGAELHALIPGGTFPAEIVEQFRLMLEWFGQAPIIVRSSSLLEDDFGNAFAGKYDSFFLANQGDPDARLAALTDAVRAIYASAMSPDALRYRQHRGLADADEQMAILVQRVSGDHHGDLFFPHAAGVGTSQNLYAFDPAVDPDAGMLRLVVGLGTRAVDRTGTDHARIVALDDPLRGRLADADELSASSQRRVDVLDLAANALGTVPLSNLTASDVGADWSLFMSPDAAALRRLRELGRRTSTTPTVTDFRGLLSRTDFPRVARDALTALERAYDYPVDVEFTVNVADGHPRLGIVQCRPLQTRGPGAAVAVPDVADDDLLFACRDTFMGGNVRIPLEYVVTVRPDAYLRLGQSDRYAVARQIGVLNRALAGHPFLLLGPGRWGTTTESLGVPVRFADISNAAALVETTYAEGNFIPELSFGSHFFADLVETGIFYCALFDHRPGVVYRRDEALKRTNVLPEMDPDSTLGHVVHVARFYDLTLYSDVPTGRALCALGRPR